MRIMSSWLAEYLSDRYVARGAFPIFFDWHHPKESFLHRIKKNLTPYLPTYYPISFKRKWQSPYWLVDVKQCIVNCFCPGEKVADNDLSISVVINDRSWFLCKHFPLAVDVMYEVDKSHGTICWAKGHHTLPLFDSVGAWEGQLLLAGENNSKYTMGASKSH